MLKRDDLIINSLPNRWQPGLSQGCNCRNLNFPVVLYIRRHKDSNTTRSSLKNNFNGIIVSRCNYYVSTHTSEMSSFNKWINDISCSQVQFSFQSGFQFSFYLICLLNAETKRLVLQPFTISLYLIPLLLYFIYSWVQKWQNSEIRKQMETYRFFLVKYLF